MLKVFSQRPGAPRPGDAEDPLVALARKAGARDRDAMRRLIVAVGPSMLRVIRTLVGPQIADAEDVLQDASEALLTAIGSFRGQCTVRHFACRVAVYSALAWRRRFTFRADRITDDAAIEEWPAKGNLSPAELVIAARRREALELLLDELPPPQAEAFILHCALDFSLDEIAAAVGRPLETVRSRLRLAKRALRDRIGGDAELAEILEMRP
ncbi:MAG TPA: RNA polymerase sigma factor [Polyangia bacterium]|nr:RNA polymerase sigma factor [Polyangia bacterium]